MAIERYEGVWQATRGAQIRFGEALVGSADEGLTEAIRDAAGALLDAAHFEHADVEIERTKTKLVVTLTHDPAAWRAHQAEIKARDAADEAANAERAAAAESPTEAS